MISRFTFLCLLAVAFSGSSVQAQFIYTFAGNGTGAATGSGTFSGDGGPAKSAGMNSPTGVAYDGAGNIYVADRANNRVRKIMPSGFIYTFAGKDTAGYSGDNGPATAAKLNKPYSVTADVSGNIYIADGGNHVIRKVTTTGIITTIAGTGVAGSTGDGGAATAALLNDPQGISIDTMGNLYIADAGNHAVREVSAGIISRVAGTGTAGYTGDGASALSATLHSPAAVATDPYGQVYIADYLNNVVRKIDTFGVISTFAGTGILGNSGDGGAANAARLRYPSGVAVFGFGPVYISDQGNNTIRMVNSAGTIYRVAGHYTNGYNGDGGMATDAELSSTKGIAVDALNRLFIADYDNNVIRVVRANTGVNNVANGAKSLKVYPNPADDAITIEMPVSGRNGTLTVTDMLGRVVNTQKVETVSTVISVAKLAAGSYIVRVVCGEEIYRAQIEVW